MLLSTPTKWWIFHFLQDPSNNNVTVTPQCEPNKSSKDSPSVITGIKIFSYILDEYLQIEFLISSSHFTMDYLGTFRL